METIHLFDKRNQRSITAHHHSQPHYPVYREHGINRQGLIDGQPVTFVLRPGYPNSVRVNFKRAEDDFWSYFDDREIHDELMNADSDFVLELSSRETGRQSLRIAPERAMLSVTTVGNSIGVVLPRHVLERLRVDKGDKLFVLETPAGIELTPYDPEFAEQMAIAERVMREDRDVLRKLAER